MPFRTSIKRPPICWTTLCRFEERLWARITQPWRPRWTIWPSSTANGESTKMPSLFASVPWRLERRSWERITPMLLSNSTTSPCCARIRANTTRLKSTTSELSTSTNQNWVPMIPMWPRQRTTSLAAIWSKEDTPRPKSFISRSWREPTNVSSERLTAKTSLFGR